MNTVPIKKLLIFLVILLGGVGIFFVCMIGEPSEPETTQETKETTIVRLPEFLTVEPSTALESWRQEVAEWREIYLNGTEKEPFLRYYDRIYYDACAALKKVGVTEKIANVMLQQMGEDPENPQLPRVSLLLAQLDFEADDVTSLTLFENECIVMGIKREKIDRIIEIADRIRTARKNGDDAALNSLKSEEKLSYTYSYEGRLYNVYELLAVDSETLGGMWRYGGLKSFLKEQEQSIYQYTQKMWMYNAWGTLIDKIRELDSGYQTYLDGLKSVFHQKYNPPHLKGFRFTDLGLYDVEYAYEVYLLSGGDKRITILPWIIIEYNVSRESFIRADIYQEYSEEDLDWLYQVVDLIRQGDFSTMLELVTTDYAFVYEDEVYTIGSLSGLASDELLEMVRQGGLKEFLEERSKWESQDPKGAFYGVFSDFLKKIEQLESAASF